MSIITTPAPRGGQTPTPQPSQTAEKIRQGDTVKGEVSQETEAPTEATTTSKEEEQLSPKFAALARKERDLRRQMQALKAREEEFKVKETEYQTSYIPKSRITEDTLGALSELGINYDDLVNQVLSQSGPETLEMKKLRAEIKAIKETQTQSATKAEEQAKQQYEHAVSQIRNEAKLLVDANSEYETIKAMGAEEAVVELIRQTFDADGTLLSVEEAAMKVEEHLLEEAMKMASLNKIRQRLAPAAPAAEAEKQAPQEKQSLKTLTNAATATSSKPTTARERRERAILAFKGQLT